MDNIQITDYFEFQNSFKFYAELSTSSYKFLSAKEFLRTCKGNSYHFIDVITQKRGTL